MASETLCNTPKEILKAAEPQIRGLLKKLGVVGTSIGIVQGDDITSLHDGARDKSIPSNEPNDETMYLTASISKPFLAAAMGVLVAEQEQKPGNTFGFDTKVGAVLSELKDGPLKECTIGNLLDHRAKIFRCDQLWEDRQMIHIQTPEQVVDIVSRLPLDKTLNSKEEKGWPDARNYTNFGYCLLAAVIERKLQQETRQANRLSWSQYLKTKVLDPAGMKHSSVNLLADGHVNKDGSQSTKNIAAGHGPEPQGYVHDDKGFSEHFLDRLTQVNQGGWALQTRSIRRSPVTDKGGIMAAPAGLMSSVQDQLNFMKLWMRLWNQKGVDKSDNSMLQRGILRTQEYIREKIEDPDYSYACGWNPVAFPITNPAHRPVADEGDNRKWMDENWFGRISIFNSGADKQHRARFDALVKRKDLCGWDPYYPKPGSARTRQYLENCWPFFLNKNGKEMTTFYHCGNMVGATAFAMMMPEIKTAIFVACNTRHFHQELASWIGQGIADCLYCSRDKKAVVDMFDVVTETALLGSATYMTKAQSHDRLVQERYREITEKDLRDGLGDACLGRYVFVEARGSDHPGVFVDIKKKDGQLKFIRNGDGHQYPMRIHIDSDYHQKGILRLNHAMLMGEWNGIELGGNIRLDPKKFDIVFHKSDLKNGKFQSFFWNFENLLDVYGGFDRKYLPGGSDDEKFIKAWSWIRADTPGSS